MKANESMGNGTTPILSVTIENVLKSNGYTEVNSYRFTSFSKISEQPIYLKSINVGQESLDTKRICSFTVFHPVKFPSKMAIEGHFSPFNESSIENGLVILSIKQPDIEQKFLLELLEDKYLLKDEKIGSLTIRLHLPEFVQLSDNGFFK